MTKIHMKLPRPSGALLHATEPLLGYLPFYSNIQLRKRTAPFALGKMRFLSEILCPLYPDVELRQSTLNAMYDYLKVICIIKETVFNLFFTYITALRTVRQIGCCETMIQWLHWAHPCGSHVFESICSCFLYKIPSGKRARRNHTSIHSQKQPNTTRQTSEGKRTVSILNFLS